MCEYVWKILCTSVILGVLIRLRPALIMLLLVCVLVQTATSGRGTRFNHSSEGHFHLQYVGHTYEHIQALLHERFGMGHEESQNG